MSSAIPAFLPAGHERHAPQLDLSDGYPPIAHPEVAARIAAIREGFEQVLDWTVETVDGRDEASVRQLHDAEYVDYLLALEPTLSDGAELVPPIFHGDLTAAPLRFRMGMYCAEIGTPIVPASVETALRSAACATRAAQAVHVHGAPLSIALCRPPGHHAGVRRYGGYCYFNNAYVAARALAGEAHRCAVLDIDYHLGDGSAEHADAGTPYYSLHADPWLNYPYLDAVAHPTGEHVDLTVLPQGITAPTYLRLLRETVGRIRDGGADRLVVSLGFDTVGSDPIQDASIALRAPDYEEIARIIAELAVPTVVVIEGGYDLYALPDCAAAFARGLRAGGLV